MQQQIQQLLKTYSPEDKAEKLFLEQAKTLAEEEDCWQRTKETAHFTASACIWNPVQKQILLIHHIALDKWLQPGGHIEAGDSSPLSAAIREVQEECCISAVEGENRLFDLDIHSIPSKKDFPSHLHYDLRFLLSTTEMGSLSSEVKGLRWMSPSELLAQGFPSSITRMVEKLK